MDTKEKPKEDSTSAPKKKIPKLKEKPKLVTSPSEKKKIPKLPKKPEQTPTPPEKKKAPKLKDTPGSSYYKGPAQAQAAQQHQARNDKNDESLTTILTAQQRTDLIVLLAAATATMRDALTATFDAHATLSPTLKKQHQQQEQRKKQTQAQQKKTRDDLNPDVDPATADVEALDRERKMLAAREKELSGPRLSELRAASLEWFDGWRTAMIGRVGEVVRDGKEDAHAEVKKDGTRQRIEETKPPVRHKNDRAVDPADGSSSNGGGGQKKKTEKDDGDDEEEDVAERLLRELYPPVKTPLAAIEERKRVVILHSMLLLLLSLEHYAAPGRVLLLYLTTSLRIPLAVLDEDEAKTARGLLEAAEHMSGDTETQKAASANAAARKWKVGLASVAGAAIVGISGGMAAPLLAAGVGSVMGGLGLGATAAAGYLGTVAGSSVIVGGLFGAYGGRMTGQMMDSYAREVSDFAFIPVQKSKGKDKNKDNAIRNEPQSQSARQGKNGENRATEDTKNGNASEPDPDNRRLRVTIGITGWLTEKEEAVKPWRVLGTASEAFALRWELESLLSLGNAMESMVRSAAWSYAQKKVIASTVFADLMPAMWPAGLAKMSRVVDNPFSVTKARAEKAGAVLADALVNRAQGERPVSLVGYSMGARVIYAALLSLAARRQFGLVNSVVLIGAPLPSEERDWRVMRSVVSGRLVNVYSQNDYVLAYLYRTSSVQLGVAGMQKVENVSGVENVDVSEAVSGHLRYRFLVGSILRKIGWEDLDMKEVEREEVELRKMDEEEERRKEELKKKLTYKKSSKGSEGEQTEKEAEEEAQKMEKDVKEKTQWSLMQKGAEWLRLGSSGKEKEKEEEDAKKREGEEGQKKGYLSSVANYAPSLPSWSGGQKSDGNSQAGVKDKQAGDNHSKGETTKKLKGANKEREGKDQRSYLEMASGGYLGGGKKS